MFLYYFAKSPNLGTNSSKNNIKNRIISKSHINHRCKYLKYPQAKLRTN